MAQKKDVKVKSSYKVNWEIEVDAYDDVDAAMLALEIQKENKSMSKVFNVTKIGFGETTKVDLSE